MGLFGLFGDNKLKSNGAERLDGSKKISGYKIENFTEFERFDRVCQVMLKTNILAFMHHERDQSTNYIWTYISIDSETSTFNVLLPNSIKWAFINNSRTLYAQLQPQEKLNGKEVCEGEYEGHAYLTVELSNNEANELFISKGLPELLDKISEVSFL